MFFHKEAIFSGQMKVFIFLFMRSIFPFVGKNTEIKEIWNLTAVRYDVKFAPDL